MNETIFVATSRRFYPIAVTIVNGLKAHMVRVFHPYFDLDANAVEIIPQLKSSVTLRHFPEIDQCDLLYALLPGGYVGCSVTIEITYAYAKGKRIVVSEAATEYAIQAMVSEVCSPEEFLSRYAKLVLTS